MLQYGHAVVEVPIAALATLPWVAPVSPPTISYWSVNFRPSYGVDDTLHSPQAQTQIGLTNRIALFQTRPNPSESQTSFLNR
jgi:hypothetical protein